MSINPEEQFLLDLGTSCTRDEAVAKLIGWLRGPVRRGFVVKKDGGIDPDQMRTAPSLLGGSLQQRLDDVRTDAQQKILAAAEVGAPDEVLDERHAALADVDALIAKAHRYMVDFDEEIARGADARIRVDHAATERTGVTHFALDSIDRWAREKYGLSVRDDERALPAETPLLDPIAAAAAETAPPNPAAGPATQESPASATRDDTNAAAESTSADANEGPAWTRTKAENLLTTFAFALEDLAKRSGTGFSIDGRMNVQRLADHLSAEAAKANGGETMPGQSTEAIKDRIEEAAKAKRARLPTR